MTPTPIGRAALQVIPLTPDQIADLVARAQANEAQASIDGHRRSAATRADLARTAYRMTRCRVAAHLVALSGGQCSAFEAARTVNSITSGRRKISHGGVWSAVRRMYPALRLRSGAKPKEKR
jgi:hypothetical protein